MNSVRALLALLLFTCTASASYAGTTYPDRQVRVIVPYPAGNSIDILTRILAEKLSSAFGGQHGVVVENIPGGSATIGANKIMEAAPDGHTLGVLGVPGMLWKQAKFGYDPHFSYVSQIGREDLYLAVSCDAPVKSAAELLRELRAVASRGEKPDYAAGSTMAKLAAAQLEKHAGFRGVNVNIGRGGEAQTVFDLLRDWEKRNRPFAFLFAPNIAANAGKICPLATIGETRHPLTPNVPALRELFPAWEALGAWTTVVAPPGTPPAILEAVSAGIRVVMADPQVRKRFEGFHVMPMATSPEEYARFALEAKKTECFARKVLQDTGSEDLRC